MVHVCGPRPIGTQERQYRQAVRTVRGGDVHAHERVAWRVLPAVPALHEVRELVALGGLRDLLRLVDDHAEGLRAAVHQGNQVFHGRSGLVAERGARLEQRLTHLVHVAHQRLEHAHQVGVAQDEIYGVRAR